MQFVLKFLIVFMTIAIADTSLLAQNTSSSEQTQKSLASLDVPFCEGNSVVLLPSGKEKFIDLFSAISQATHYVHLEYFNFRNDSIGWSLFTLLSEKAQQGVEVRILCDDFGNRSNDHPLRKSHLDSLRSMGLDICIFDPLKFPYINHFYHRDHMKIVVIDGKLVYTGGMNVADYYIHGKPNIGPWHDMHMRLDGPVVAEYEKIFAKMWKSETGIALDEEKYLPDSRPVNESYQSIKVDSTDDAGRKLLAVVHRRPGKDSKLMRKSYVAAINSAQHYIQIVNPYPTGVRSVRRAINNALKRGVKVDFMVSSKCDVPITPDVVAIQMKRFMSHGCNVYYNDDGFHHSKYMVVDGEFCTIGSANLDARSMLFDYEVNSFIFSPCTASQLSTLFEQDKTKSTLLTPEGWKKRFNIWHRIVGRLFGAFKGFI